MTNLIFPKVFIINNSFDNIFVKTIDSNKIFKSGIEAMFKKLHS